MHPTDCDCLVGLSLQHVSQLLVELPLMGQQLCTVGPVRCIFLGKASAPLLTLSMHQKGSAYVPSSLLAEFACFLLTLLSGCTGQHL